MAKAFTAFEVRKFLTQGTPSKPVFKRVKEGDLWDHIAVYGLSNGKWYWVEDVVDERHGASVVSSLNFKHGIKPDPYEGNDCTGDLECLRPFLKIRKVEDNWVVGSAVGHDCSEVQIKMYAEPSEFGIEEGRISKLHVFTAKTAENLKTSKRKEEVSYDRGWDTKPKSKFFQLWTTQLVKAVQ